MAKLRDIVHYFRADWKLGVLTITISCIYEVIDLIVPYTTGQTVNLLSGQPLDRPLQKAIATISQVIHYPANDILVLGILLVVMFVATVLKSPIEPWMTSWFHWDIALRAKRNQAQKVIEKILTLPLEFYEENNPGRIAGRIARGLANHTWTYAEVAGQMIPKMVRMLAIFFIIWFVEWRVAILLLVSFIVILGYTLKELYRINWHEIRIDKYMEDTESRTSELITNIKTVKAFATENQELEHQKERLERELKVVDYRIHKMYVMLGSYQRTMVSICVFIVFGITLVETVNHKISLGHFIMTLTLANMAYAELQPIGSLAENLGRRMTSMLRFHEFLQVPSNSDADSSLTSLQTEIPAKFAGKLEFNHVNFGYEPNYPVLQNINLLIEPYQTVALVGKSGSGKSTLVKLLLRYFEPQSGQILIDGQDIRSLNISQYRRRLAIVHQEVDVFNGTILSNITYGRPNATDAEVAEACRIAKVDEIVSILPQGYYTVIGERGLRLSGGQRQRLGIARALLVEPDVLIFDEATSSLDYESERSIQLAMSAIQGTRTTIIIAHRLSTVREADQIVVLDKGRIVEVGNHQQLLHHRGIYYRLHSLQEDGAIVG